MLNALVTKLFKVSIEALQGVSLVLTMFRLAFRLKIRRFWWEDAWAAVGFVCGVTFIIVTRIYLDVGGEAPVIAAWISSYMFTTIVWAVRMSLITSILRIIPPSKLLRRICFVLAAIFFLVWATLVALKTWNCAANKTWEKSRGPSGKPVCYIPSSFAIFELTTDFAADAILVFLSLKLLWRVKLPSRQRRMILSIFSSCATISIFSLIHALTQLIPIPSAQAIFTDLELVSSMIVCNLLVVVTYAYRTILGSTAGESSDSSESTAQDDDFTSRLPTSTQHLTTVDWSLPFNSGPTTLGTR
ncbi:hypothetical protein HYDPIDRAFT_189100 [Hydnomerulius pinastri MD-312]|uniref:Rhodopsin domain-containing protein n=1 Tax=Hydnomerulius pinastri MD-312 TaxID=994086 RepID=A0A0C9W627_9AGAM|nr:hypothetical protein HYDPIDRAFT_189100 [Hydnomerulius pinastri MD-312]